MKVIFSSTYFRDDEKRYVFTKKIISKIKQIHPVEVIRKKKLSSTKEVFEIFRIKNPNLKIGVVCRGVNVVACIKDDLAELVKEKCHIIFCLYKLRMKAVYAIQSYDEDYQEIDIRFHSGNNKRKLSTVIKKFEEQINKPLSYFKERKINKTKRIVSLAPELKKMKTPIEKVLIQEFKNGKLGGLSFLRQRPLGFSLESGEYVIIADFYCYKKDLIIQVEDRNRDYHEDYEIHKDIAVKKFSYRLLEVKKSDLEDIESLKKRILAVRARRR